MTAEISYPLPSPPTIYHPLPELLDYQQNQPVVQVRMADGTEAWLVSRYEDVRQILVDQRFSRAATAGPGGPAKELGDLETQSLIGMDPPSTPGCAGSWPTPSPRAGSRSCGPGWHAWWRS